MAESSNKWWEFYFIRYFVGSAFGALIITALAFHPESSLNSVVLELLKINVDSFTLKSDYFIVILLFGVTFCYVASAPILVLHTCRVHLNHKAALSPSKWWFIIAIIAVILIQHCFLKFSIDKLILFFLFTVLIVYQFILIPFTSKNKDAENGFFEFYNNLTTNRNKVKDSAGAQYIESYKHLREHGNAFFILICEFALGAALFKTSTINEAISIIFLWILPAMTVWFLATYLESRLKDI